MSITTEKPISVRHERVALGIAVFVAIVALACFAEALRIACAIA